MLVVKNRLASSSIHGLGVFADEFIPSGSVIWKWYDGIDGKTNIKTIKSLPLACQDFFNVYGWSENGIYKYCIDNQKYINHSNTPNCVLIDGGNTGIANKNIDIGEEITEDYKSFVDNFDIKDFK
jgi:SET domain-containing protein